MPNIDYHGEISPVFCLKPGVDCSGSSEYKYEYAFVTCLLIVNGYLIGYIVKNRHRIPIRQRAPTISAIHAFSNWLTIAVTFGVDLIVRKDSFGWFEPSINSPKEIPVSRYIAKYTIIFSRLGTSFLSIFR